MIKIVDGQFRFDQIGEKRIDLDCCRRRTQELRSKGGRARTSKRINDAGHVFGFRNGALGQLRRECFLEAAPALEWDRH